MQKLLYLLNIIIYLTVYDVFALDLYTFHNGQASCSLLTVEPETNSKEHDNKFKYNKRAVFFDYGCSNPALYHYGTTGYKSIKNLLLDVGSCDFMCTHNHQDHTNMLTNILSIIESINAERKMKSQDPKNNLITIDQKLFFKDQLTCLEWSPNYHKNESTYYRDPHDNMKVFKVSYNGKSILFLGDASSRCLSILLRHTDVAIDLLEGLDVIIMPHHGSNNNGEFCWWGVMNLINGMQRKSDFQGYTIVQNQRNSSLLYPMSHLNWGHLLITECDKCSNAGLGGCYYKIKFSRDTILCTDNNNHQIEWI